MALDLLDMKFEPITRKFVRSRGLGSGTPVTSAKWLRALLLAVDMKEGDTVFDYGCGNGRLVNWMSYYFEDFTYYGLEPNTHHGKRYILTGEHLLSHDPRVNLGFLDDGPLYRRALKTSTLVVLGSIITHYKPDQAIEILSRFKPVLERGGKVVFSVGLIEDEQLAKTIHPRYGDPNAYDLKGCLGHAFHDQAFMDRVEEEVGPYRIHAEVHKAKPYHHNFVTVEGPPV